MLGVYIHHRRGLSSSLCSLRPQEGEYFEKLLRNLGNRDETTYQNRILDILFSQVGARTMCINALCIN